MPILDQGFLIRAPRVARRAARSSAFVLGALIAAVLPNLSGCNAMSSPQEAGMELAVKIDTSKPIRFSTHAFGAHCFDATQCRVVYFDSIVRSGSSESEPYPRGNLSKRLVAPHIGIPNFPAPISVSWVASDGTPLQTEVDVAEIFKDQLVRHRVPKDQLPEFLFSPVEPDIILVIHDRKLDLYTRAHIPTRVLQDPGNPYSDFRSDLMLVHSSSY